MIHALVSVSPKPGCYLHNVTGSARSRRLYEVELNRVTVNVHLSQFYHCSSGALQPLSESCAFVQVALDRRSTLTELKVKIREVGNVGLRRTVAGSVFFFIFCCLGNGTPFIRTLLCQSRSDI